MKHLVLAALVAASSLSAWSLDHPKGELSMRFNDRLLELKAPTAPELIEGQVLFTASAARGSVGISFEHESYGKVHWFKRLETRSTEISREGVLLFIYEYPRDLKSLKYRLVIDGLWSADPWNPSVSTDRATGIACSVVALPPPLERPEAADVVPGVLSLYWEGQRGQSVCVAGNFNQWDPFMYELDEVSPGKYSLNIPLPPGTYQYAFYLRGERFPDPLNHRKVYTTEGKIASLATVR